jgi:outer membrane immunogenic protein
MAISRFFAFSAAMVLITGMTMPALAGGRTQTISWAGFYAGLNAGYGWGSASTDLVALDPANFIPAQMVGALPTELSPHVDGFVGGGQIGYNWQFDRTVVGLEADIAYSAMKGDDSFSSNIFPDPSMTVTQTNKVTWLGTLRPRVGWLWNPSTLIYASGGLAYGGVKASTNINVNNLPPLLSCPAGNGFCSIGSLSGTRVGWTVGGGMESFIGSHWSLRIDYLYFDLGHESYDMISTIPGGTEVMRAEAKFNGHIVRAGLNYHF